MIITANLFGLRDDFTLGSISQRRIVDGETCRDVASAACVKPIATRAALNSAGFISWVPFGWWLKILRCKCGEDCGGGYTDHKQNGGG